MRPCHTPPVPATTAALVLSLVLGTPSDQEPAPANLWSQSGARSWTLCNRYEVEAEQQLRAGTPRSEPKLLMQWQTRIETCPQLPAALVLTARLEIENPPRVDRAVDFLDELPELDRAIREQRRLVLELLVAAEVEAERRGETLPAPGRYLAAYAAIGLGDAALAKPLVKAARAAGEIDSWRIDRLAALVAVFQGDLQSALRLAHRARIHATTGGRPASTFVLALVLDRQGSIAAARGLLSALRVRDSRTLSSLDTLLPLNERLYLMALYQEAKGHSAGAYTLWQAYLEREGVDAPEREQVRRRMLELRSSPTLAK